MHKYQILGQIGHGAYSIVFKARDLTRNNIVAIKRINHTNPDISVVLGRQIRALQSLQHPNIIRLLEVCSDSQYAYLVFQYLPYDLITYYKQVKKIKGRNLNDEEIVYISWQMCQALGYMHQNGLMHRDIKPQNVLIDPSTLNIKLIDFGFATYVNQYGQNTQYMITRWYRPLQIVLNLPYDGKADIFALGALLLELYLGEEVFRSASNIDQLYWILEICGYPSNWSQAIQKMAQIGINFSPTKQPEIYKLTSGLRHDAANLIISMLHTNPFRRFSIIQILNHTYFSELRQNIMRKNSLINRSSNPLPNSYSNPMLKTSISRNTLPEQIKDTTQNPLKTLKMKANNNSASNLTNMSKLQKMKKGLSLQKNDPIIERHQAKIQNSNTNTTTNYLSSSNKNQESQFHIDQNEIALKQQNKQFSIQKFQKAYNSPVNNVIPSDFQKEKQQIHKLHRTQSYGFTKKNADNGQKYQKSNQNIKFFKNNTNNNQKKNVRYKTEGYQNDYSKQKQKQIDKQLQKDMQYIRKHGNLQGHTRSNSSLSIEKKFQHQKIKNKQKNVGNQLDQQAKGLKFRTKSYQGISIVSLKRDSYTGYNNLNKYNHSNIMMSTNSNSSKGYNNVIKNPQKPYQTTYQTNMNIGYSNQTAVNNNYAVGSNKYQVPPPPPIHNLQNNVKRKQATFTKIRDKLLNDNKPLGKIKISLTQREKNNLFEQKQHAHKHYQVRNFG